jgi:hypothetical protein
MTLRTCLFGLLAIACANTAHAQIIKLEPATINVGDTTTTSFTDAFVTLTPFLGGVADTFNGGTAPRLGMDSVGSNANAFNDPDGVAGNEDDESLQFVFASGAGLEEISYDFSRADGPDAGDGVIITGFLANPNVTFSVDDENLFAVYDAVAGSVRLNIPGTLFGGTEVFIGFNASASDGQTLLMTVNDSTQANAQFAIRSISYNTAPVAPVTLLGDCNLDGEVTFLDITPFINILSGATASIPEADCNEDGEVTFLDITPFISILSGGS